MKNIILICLLFVATGLTAQVHIPDPNEKPSQAEIKFEKDVHDYGTIKQGANGSYEFKFKNTGKEPLIIRDAQGSCGCTVPEWPKAPIRPGETASIKVTYDTNRLGPIDKSVKISSNSKTESEKVLKIKGTVEAAN
jgi:hypothetical protein